MLLKAVVVGCGLLYFFTHSLLLVTVVFLPVVLVPLVRLAFNSDFYHFFFPCVRARTVDIDPALHTSLRPGQFFVRTLAKAARTVSSRQRARIRIATWNVERGYQLPEIIAQLKQLEPDILLLQEVDVGCVRSGNVDVGAEIGFHLGLPHYLFACEQRVLNDAHGVHGNAILSRWPFLDTWAPVLPCGRASRAHDPSDKAHACAAARIAPHSSNDDNDAASQTHRTLCVWSVHFDPHYTGIRGHLTQWSAVMKDAVERRRRPSSSLDRAAEHQRASPEPACVGGDLNTLCDGAKRFFGRFCCDDLRWKSMGLTEPQYWEKHVLSVPDELGTRWHDPSGIDRPTHRVFRGLISSCKLDWLLVSGLSAWSGAQAVITGDHASDHCLVSMDFEWSAVNEEPFSL